MDSFTAKFVKTSECWNWISTTRKPYAKRPGNLCYGLFRRKSGWTNAHRVSFELFKGPIPDGLHVLHKCDNPLCVNPDHLFLGDQDINMKDCNKKERNARGIMLPTAKLTDDAVREIKRDYKPYCRRYGMRHFSEKFGVSSSIISGVITGDRWGHVK